MKISIGFVAVLALFCAGQTIAERTDIELDAKANRLHRIDSLVSQFFCFCPKLMINFLCGLCRIFFSTLFC